MVGIHLTVAKRAKRMPDTSLETTSSAYFSYKNPPLMFRNHPLLATLQLKWGKQIQW